MGSSPLAPDRHDGLSVGLKMSCNRDMKTVSINPANWETQAADPSSCRTAIRTCIRMSERLRREKWKEKKEHKKQTAETTAEPGAKTFKCSN